MIPLVVTWPGLGQPGKTPLSHAVAPDAGGLGAVDPPSAADDPGAAVGAGAGTHAARSIAVRASVAATLQPGNQARERVDGMTWGRPVWRRGVRARRGTG
jgi:hypothetical protein